MGNQNHALGVNADFGGDGAVSNNEWARHLGADYDNDGNVTGKEWMQYGGQSPGQGFPPRPGNIPNMGPGIFNFQPPGAQGGGLTPGMGAQPMPPQQPSPQTNPQVMPQGTLQSGGGLGMDPRAPRDMTAQEPGNPTAMSQGTPGQWQPQPPVRGGSGLNPGIGIQPGTAQAYMPNPQVPAFDPSIFNMQPAMVNRPMPQGMSRQR